MATAATAPSREYPPPVDSADEFVKRELDAEDERIDVGVVIVGGGPAGLACANRLLQLLAEDEPRCPSASARCRWRWSRRARRAARTTCRARCMRPRRCGSCSRTSTRRSGRSLRRGGQGGGLLMLTSKQRAAAQADAAAVPQPRQLRRVGRRAGRWLAEKAEEAGAYILHRDRGHSCSSRTASCVGVRSGDKGRGKDGEELGNFEPGSDVMAKATVLAEGTLGPSHRRRDPRLRPRRRTATTGVGARRQGGLGGPEAARPVIHTLGWPLRKRAPSTASSAARWIYPMGEDKVSIGFVVGLDYTDATCLGPRRAPGVQAHPLVREILEGGKRVAWGAKTIPDGRLLGDAAAHGAGHRARRRRAGMVNMLTLKGIHYAIHAGCSPPRRSSRRSRTARRTSRPTSSAVEDSVIGKDLYDRGT